MFAAVKKKLRKDSNATNSSLPSTLLRVIVNHEQRVAEIHAPPPKSPSRLGDAFAAQIFVFTAVRTYVVFCAFTDHLKQILYRVRPPAPKQGEGGGSAHPARCYGKTKGSMDTIDRHPG